MNDTMKIINENRNRINFYEHEIKKLEDYIEHGTDESYIRDFKSKIKDYETCIECLQRDIKGLQKHYDKLVVGIYDTKDGEKSVYLNINSDSLMMGKQGSGYKSYKSYINNGKKDK